MARSPVGIRFECGTEDRQSKDFGPFEYAQLTYESLRVDDGEWFACYHEGWWILEDQKIDDGKYTDVVIYSWID